MIQANKTDRPLKLNKEQASMYVVRVFMVNPEGYPVRDAPERIFHYSQLDWLRTAKKLAYVGKGYEVLHDPTIKPKRVTKSAE